MQRRPMHSPAYRERRARVPDAEWPHPAGRPCIDVAAPQSPITTEACDAA
jgi:hypothetical protein